MYTNDFGETVKIKYSSFDISTTDNQEYPKITKIINSFDLNLIKNNPYEDEEKNKSCFLKIETEYEYVLVVFKTEDDPQRFFYYFEAHYDYITDSYPDLFKEGMLNIDLINDDNQLVLMYGTSIIILDINTFEVINYTSSNKIKNYGIKISYNNNIYSVVDDENNIINFDKNLNILN